MAFRGTNFRLFIEDKPELARARMLAVLERHAGVRVRAMADVGCKTYSTFMIWARLLGLDLAELDREHGWERRRSGGAGFHNPDPKARALKALRTKETMKERGVKPGPLRKSAES
jgi:hypothetical protein